MSELRRLDAADVASLCDPEEVRRRSQPVVRRDGGGIDVNVFDELMIEFVRRRIDGVWDDDRAASDRWLAPRLHYALRLTRREAADRLTWAWLANRHAEVVTWRWRDARGLVAGDRLVGPIHKQALARLWWGAELFRDGGDYRPVERAFVLQDLPNSFLHRPLVRCRSLALGLVEVMVPASMSGPALGAADVNGVARVLNLVTAGSPPEIETGFRRDDRAAYARWVARAATVPTSWAALPPGPDSVDTSAESVEAGAGIVRRARSLVTVPTTTKDRT